MEIFSSAPGFLESKDGLMRWIFLLFIALLPLRAQEASPSPSPSPDEPGLRGAPIWRCILPGGSYEVALRSMVSVSQHEYLVDNVARVTEVNVDTTGSLAVRFYFLEPVAPQAPMGVGQSTLGKLEELAKEASDRTGQDQIWKKVVKSYPLTTHARTIEYRLETKDQLTKLFESAEKAFRENKAGTFRLQ